MPTTATPPFVPAGRPGGGIGAGLFGGSPYPIDPAIQQGLMRDAWRQFGIQLLASAQSPDIGRGLASALLAGRQAYAGGAEQAYQVGRQGEQDAQQRQYYESLGEYRKAQAQATLEPEEPKPVKWQALPSVPGVLFNPETQETKRVEDVPEKDQPPVRWQAVPGVPGKVYNPVTLETKQVAQAPLRPRAGASKPPENQMLEYVLSRVDNIVKDGKGQVTPEQAAAFAVQEWQAAQSAAAAPDKPPAGPSPVAPEDILEAAGVPQAKRTPEAIAWVRAQLGQATAEQIIELLRRQ